MQKVEIKEFGLMSVFKFVLILFSIPALLMGVIIFFISLTGVVQGSIGEIFIFIPAIIMLVVYAVIHGLLAVLFALVYNKFSPKVGALELKVSLNEKENISQQPEVEQS
ncbi:hypothetical protein [Alkalibacillus haloalkaliphilus]|uniref:DUF3566 domain-containing protein n=1 Tax=Alkalibacillus haloalkaliphilus TaxID=94136 RepID=A0A511W145_9BACI|nr:hypothetical protein [Alkalibacillus haloalkaliphilus]GEN44461.1 hypothetical protein AHA02nite_02370 [Alkalibacillus haloalkaliphilus]